MEDQSVNAQNGHHYDSIPFIDDEETVEGQHSLLSLESVPSPISSEESSKISPSTSEEQESPATAIPEVTDSDAEETRLVFGKFRFDVEEDVVDYDSDESFYCISDDDEDSTSCSSGDEGDYDLGVAEDSSEGESDLEDEVDGVLHTDGDQPLVFPWKDYGVVDLETASKWDFTTLTKNCKPVVKEILERVVSFTRRLRRVEEFRSMLEANSVVAKEDLHKIFLNLDEVLKLQVAVLGGFRKELLKRPLKPRVGRVLRRFIPFLRLHEDLACKNGLCRRTIRSLCDKNTKFRNAHDRFKATGTKHSLDDLLLEPHKYIVDLKQLLQRYLKHIQGSEDYHDTTDALSAIEHVLEVIDDKSMQYYEQTTRMLDIREILKKRNIEIIKAHRILKREGKLCLLSPQTGIPVHCEVFLFNDVLLMCTPYLLDSKRLSSVRIISMDKTVVTQEGADIIVVYSPDKVTELQISKKLDEWFQALTEAADPPTNYDIKDNIVKCDAPLGTRAPRYVPAATVRSCSLCQKSFTRRSKAYHCRACGKVVCVNCCGHKVSLAYLGEDREPRRVCDICHRHLQLNTL